MNRMPPQYTWKDDGTYNTVDLNITRINFYLIVCPKWFYRTEATNDSTRILPSNKNCYMYVLETNSALINIVHMYQFP